MKPHHRLHITLALLALTLTLALAPAARADFKKGDTAYTKRLETTLLAEPKPLAAPTAKLDFAKPLKIDEVRGPWLHVTSKTPKAAGWVYNGNLSATEPAIAPATGMVADTASKTTVAAAARPFTKIANEYAQAQNLGSTQLDAWLNTFASTITNDDITRYLTEHKLGEYQQ